MNGRGPDAAGSGTRKRLGQETRCLCGSLLARLRPDGVELKCHRCKRYVIVRWSDRDFRSLAPRARCPP